MFLSNFQGPVQDLPGIGPAMARLLSGIGVRSQADLLLYLPRAYQDRTARPLFRFAADGGAVAVRVTVVSHSRVRLKRGGFLLKIQVTDGVEQGELLCFNRPFLAKSLPPGAEAALYGRFEQQRGLWQSSDFEYELLSAGEEALFFGRIVPVYPLVKGLTQKVVRRAVLSMVTNLEDLEGPLPAYLRQKRNLMPLGRMIAMLHYPSDGQALEIARRNMTYFEFFIFEAAFVYRRHLRKVLRKNRLYSGADCADEAQQIFGFALTSGQQQVVAEILSDLRSPAPMQRLLMGDVGSGKTAVACMAILTAARSGYQTSVVAPTAVLAHQLFLRLRAYLEPSGVQVSFLSGRTPVRERREVERTLEEGTLAVVVGTHVLFSDSIRFLSLGLVVIDEQQRFGVRQRSVLLQKGDAVDYLAMSATPIPRTLALTRYGDLDVSRISGLPSGREPVRTEWLAGDQTKACCVLRERLEEGEQAFLVFPVIEGTEKSDREAVESAFRHLSRSELAGFGVELLHGRMGEEEKLEAMSRFQQGAFGVLVATTVVEVGVDNPNATVMIINSAQRFGLSQLHQLRGRVGRGGRQGYCFLLTGSSPGDTAAARMSVLVQETDGFRIAEEDLRIRGQGELSGSAQSGLPLFRVADPVRDIEYLETVRRDAAFILERDPNLASSHNSGLQWIFSGGTKMGSEWYADQWRKIQREKTRGAGKRSASHYG